MKREPVAAAVPHRDYLLRRLADPASAAAYLNAAAKENDPSAFLQALRNVVEARGGIAKVADRADLNRQAIYKMLSEKGNPELRSLQSLLGATGLELNVVAAEESRANYRVGGKPKAKTKRRKVQRTPAEKLAA
jgi:probable addiction module antidote protein